MISDQGFKKACAILAEPKPIGSSTALLPEIVLVDVLERINGEPNQCGLPLGKGLVDRLVDAFPAYDRKAHKRYLESLIEMFGLVPLSCGHAAVDRLSQYPEFPSTGDVGRELKAQTDERTVILAAAVGHQRERETRAEAMIAQREFEKAKLPIEERRRIVQQTLGAKQNV